MKSDTIIETWWGYRIATSEDAQKARILELEAALTSAQQEIANLKSQLGALYE